MSNQVLHLHPVERDTLGTSMLLAVVGDTHYTSLLLAVEMDTNCTPILLVLVVVKGILSARPKSR